MTIPARGWLVLRRVAGKRLPLHSVERRWDDAGVQTTLPSVCSDLVESWQRSRYHSVFGGGKWEIPDEGFDKFTDSQRCTILHPRLFASEVPSEAEVFLGRIAAYSSMVDSVSYSQASVLSLVPKRRDPATPCHFV